MRDILVLLCALAPLAPAAPTPFTALDSSHVQAARELLEAMEIPSPAPSLADAMMDARVRAHPALAPYHEVLASWARRYLSWEQVGPTKTQTYMAAFTESELREIAAFWRTPVGRKALTELPRIMQEAAAIGSAVGEKYGPELMRLIEEEAAKSGRTVKRL